MIKIEEKGNFKRKTKAHFYRLNLVEVKTRNYYVYLGRPQNHLNKSHVFWHIAIWAKCPWQSQDSGKMGDIQQFDLS